MNKRAGASAETVQMVYRTLLIFVIAFTILGLGAIFYGVYINTRDAEARTLVSQVKDCIVKEGKVDLTGEMMRYQNNLLDYCKINGTGKVYVYVSIDKSGQNYVFQHGDSGKTWIADFFSKKTVQDRLATYKPGYAGEIFHYPEGFNGNSFYLRIIVEVYVFDDRT